MLRWVKRGNQKDKETQENVQAVALLCCLYPIIHFIGECYINPEKLESYVPNWVNQ